MHSFDLTVISISTTCFLSIVKHSDLTLDINLLTGAEKINTSHLKSKRQMHAEDSAESSNVLERDTSRSLAATLELAKTKGYVDKVAKKQPTVVISSAKKAKIEAKAYMVDERRGDDRRDHRRSTRPAGSGGPSSSSSNQIRQVREPEDYKPEINLEYTDDTGRKLETPREAYRHMCYKFHGKGPGKNKIDKRLRKQELERKMKQSLSTDVPSSAALMISKQKELQMPFIVLNKGK